MSDGGSGADPLAEIARLEIERDEALTALVLITAVYDIDLQPFLEEAARAVRRVTTSEMVTNAHTDSHDAH